jgi:hypothetical protein
VRLHYCKRLLKNKLKLNIIGGGKFFHVVIFFRVKKNDKNNIIKNEVNQIIKIAKFIIALIEGRKPAGIFWSKYKLSPGQF